MSQIAACLPCAPPDVTEPSRLVSTEDQHYRLILIRRGPLLLGYLMLFFSDVYFWLGSTLSKYQVLHLCHRKSKKVSRGMLRLTSTACLFWVWANVAHSTSLLFYSLHLDCCSSK